MVAERRKLSRRNFSYYMRVLDEVTGKLIGHLSDISTDGFKLDCSRPVQLRVDFRLRIDQTSDISDKHFLIFSARAIWCKMDYLDPSTYQVGFNITNMPPSDYEVFLKMFDVYGTKSTARRRSNLEYIWG
ncbi:MAG: PilZ domain-containing protein [Anaerolineales bacterium]|nr:PilZ domain-containing protein [Anaerolineales bacterium]